MFKNIQFQIQFKFNPNPISNSNFPAIFQKVPKLSKNKQTNKRTQVMSSYDLVKSETNCNDVCLKKINKLMFKNLHVPKLYLKNLPKPLIPNAPFTFSKNQILV